MKKCYTILTVAYDLDEAGEHFGDADIGIQVADDKEKANAVIDEIEKKFNAEEDEDGEPQDYYVERTDNGLTATNTMTEITVTVKEQVIA